MNKTLLTSMIASSILLISGCGSVDDLNKKDDDTSNALSSSIDTKADYIKIENSASKTRCEATLAVYNDQYLNVKAVYSTTDKNCESYGRTSIKHGNCIDQYLATSGDGTCLYSYDFDTAPLSSSIDFDADNIWIYQGVNAGTCMLTLEQMKVLYRSSPVKAEIKPGIIACQDITNSGSCTEKDVVPTDLNQTCLISFSR